MNGLKSIDTKKFKSLLFWILAVLTSVLLVYNGCVYIANANKPQYYEKIITEGDHTKILQDFKLLRFSADMIKGMSIVASNKKEAHLTITLNTRVDTTVLKKACRDITDGTDGLICERLNDNYIELLAGYEIIWQWISEDARIRYYESSIHDCVLTVKLPLDMYEYAKEGGTETNGFPLTIALIRKS